MRPPVFHSAGRSHVGKVRQVNEDAFLCRDEAGLWAVADGMGGHHAGDVASQAIVHALGQIPRREALSEAVDAVDDMLEQANTSLRYRAAAQEPPRTCGSTVVALLLRDRCGAILWAGDSRLYRLRHGQLAQLSEDHSQVQDLVKQGMILEEDAAAHPAANVITRAVGAADRLCLDVDVFQVQPGDIFLLCSDGLYREVGETELPTLLAQPPAQAAAACVQAALARGGRDNITAVVVQAQAETGAA
ncbi:MAG TPA: serine/threonine-protein phosphatase [Gammaproteobacteria bacterium]|nr:serine/threonine-protein phosphatase [Gammaproteobacteria bacterium]